MNELFHQLRWALPIWLVGLLTNWLPDNRVTVRLRGALARPFIRKCGRRFLLGAHVTLLNTNRLEIGDGVAAGLHHPENPVPALPRQTRRFGRRQRHHRMWRHDRRVRICRRRCGGDP